MRACVALCVDVCQKANVTDESTYQKTCCPFGPVQSCNGSLSTRLGKTGVWHVAHIRKSSSHGVTHDQPSLHSSALSYDDWHATIFAGGQNGCKSYSIN